MPDNNEQSFENQPTRPLHFEEYVKNQFELMFVRMDGFDARMDKFDQRMGGLETKIAGVESGLRSEMVERFLQLSRQLREVDTRVAKVEERVEDLDFKVDGFIKEQLRMKREWREFQDKHTT